MSTEPVPPEPPAQWHTFVNENWPPLPKMSPPPSSLAISACVGNEKSEALAELRAKGGGALDDEEAVARTLRAAIHGAGTPCARLRVGLALLAVLLSIGIVDIRRRAAMVLPEWLELQWHTHAHAGEALGESGATDVACMALCVELMLRCWLDLASVALLVLVLVCASDVPEQWLRELPSALQPDAAGAGAQAFMSVPRMIITVSTPHASSTTSSPPPSLPPYSPRAMSRHAPAPPSPPRPAAPQTDEQPAERGARALSPGVAAAAPFWLRPPIAALAMEAVLCAKLGASLFCTGWLASAATSVLVHMNRWHSHAHTPGERMREHFVFAMLVASALASMSNSVLSFYALCPLLRLRVGALGRGGSSLLQPFALQLPLPVAEPAEPRPDEARQRDEAWRVQMAWRACGLHGLSDVLMNCVWIAIALVSVSERGSEHPSESAAASSEFARKVARSSIALAVLVCLVALVLSVLTFRRRLRALCSAAAQRLLSAKGPLHALAPLVGYGAAECAFVPAPGRAASRRVAPAEAEWVRPVVLNAAALLQLGRLWKRGNAAAVDAVCAGAGPPPLAAPPPAAEPQLPRAPAGSEIDFYIAHAWHDSPDAKLCLLRTFAASFEQEHGRPPVVWVDALCAPPVHAGGAHSRSGQEGGSARDAEEAMELARMPHRLSRARGLLLVVGPFFFSRLWCALEVYTWFALGGSAEGLTLLAVPTAANKGKYGLCGAPSSASTHGLPVRPLSSLAQGFKASRATAASAVQRRQLRLCVQLGREWRVNSLMHLLGHHVTGALKAAHWSNSCTPLASSFGTSVPPRMSNGSSGSVRSALVLARTRSAADVGAAAGAAEGASGSRRAASGARRTRSTSPAGRAQARVENRA